MANRRFGFAHFASAIIAVLLGGCGLETVNVADTTRPVVTSTSPAAGATGVSLTTAVSATFSKPMTATTINATTFTLSGPGGTAVPGAVTYAPATQTATLTLPTALAANTTYLATVTTGATDTASPANSLASNYTWAFTTAGAPVAPAVILTAPANLATNVPLNQVLSATFNSAMNAATINTNTFTVTAAGVRISGQVTYSATGNIASFAPAAPLTPATTYVATVTTGAQNTAGTGLAANYTWTFTTALAPLAPTVILTNPASSATNVSVTQALSATFSQPMNTATINSSTFTLSAPGGTAVTGAVSYNATTSIATFTPSAPLLSNTTYLATITTGSQNSTGTALAANYTWTFTTAPPPVPPTVTSTSPASGATNVALTQAVSATFSTAMNAATINGSTFTLQGPGGTAIAGAVTYAPGTNTATLTPAASLAAGTTYIATVTTGAQNLAGTALAANYAFSFTTAAATPPTVTSTSPASGATNVAITQAVSATFSTAMNAATINGSTFTLQGPGGTAIAGAVTYAPGTNTATLTPAASLAAGTTYIATVTTGAQNLAGTALAANYAFSFTTAAATPPTVTSTSPASGATNVAITQAVSATFSTAMNAATINGSTFTLQGPGGTAIAGAITFAPGTNTATLTPSASLTAGTTYIATVTTGAQNVAGTALAGNYVFSFTTVPPPTPPTVTSTISANGATGVPLNQPLSATFSTSINPSTLTGSSFTVSSSAGVVVTGAITYSPTTNTATFTPSSNLMTSTTYVATITTAVKNTAGTALAANYVWVFRTAPALAPPTVISTNPADKASGVAFNQALGATFSVAMDPATINSNTFTVTAPGAVPVAGTVSYAVGGSVATFTPTVPLLPLTTYVATITTGAQNLTGTALASNYVWTFTTGAAPDTTRPIVIATIPQNGATGVPFNQAIGVTFSKAMNPNTITTTSFTVSGPGTVIVNGLVSYSAISNTATFTPTSNLAPATLFTVTVTTAAADLAGNTLASNYVFTFTTGPAPDVTKPTITLTNPVDQANGVPLTQAVSAVFSKPMDPLTINTATFTLTGSGNVAVTGTVSYDSVNNIATFLPSSPLVQSTVYTATVTTGAADLAGNTLGAGSIPNPWTFTTGATIVVPPVRLGTAALFGGFGGGAGMTNMGTSTVVNGNIGTTGVSTLITGFHDNGVGCIYTETTLNIGYVNGSIVTAPPPPTVQCPTEGTALTSAQAAQAAMDAQTAYAALVAFPGGLDVSTCAACGGGSAGELGNRVLAAGVYKSAPGSFGITTGDLTLDAKGDPNAFWVFQMGTTFTVGTPQGHRSILLVNGAQAKNVFWQVGTAATINGVLGGGTMVGTVISQSGISVSTAGVAAITTINGRLLVLTGPVTLVNTVINVPAP